VHADHPACHELTAEVAHEERGCKTCCMHFVNTTNRVHLRVDRVRMSIGGEATGREAAPWLRSTKQGYQTAGRFASNVGSIQCCPCACAVVNKQMLQSFNR
jgi:hypothetical protein